MQTILFTLVTLWLHNSENLSKVTELYILNIFSPDLHLKPRHPFPCLSAFSTQILLGYFKQHNEQSHFSAQKYYSPQVSILDPFLKITYSKGSPAMPSSTLMTSVTMSKFTNPKFYLQLRTHSCTRAPHPYPSYRKTCLSLFLHLNLQSSIQTFSTY